MITEMQPFENIFQASSSMGPNWVVKEKERAWKEFCEKGVPTRKEEDWKYTNLSFLKKTKYHNPEQDFAMDHDKIATFMIPDAINICYVDGFFVDLYDEISNLPEGLEITSLASAFTSQKKQLETLQASFESLCNPNSLIRLNEAIASNGLLIKINKKAHLERPIHIVHINSQKSGLPIASFTRNIVVADEESTSKIYESFYCLDSADTGVRHFANKTCDIHLKQNAKLSYVCTQNINKTRDQICHTRVIQEKNSTFESNVLGVGGKLTRQSIDVWQAGEAAHSSLNGLFLACEKQQCEQRTYVRHKALHGTSDQYYKGILDGESRGVFLGHVGVEKDAQKVQAKQLNKNLLLSDQVEIDTKPELEIDADDVKCAHGATVSQLRSDEIFYLQSRAIGKEKAKNLLSHAFAYEIISKVKDENIAQIWDQIVKSFFENEAR